jgi:GH24 family phage-related lysozyme (muramidase)
MRQFVKIILIVLFTMICSPDIIYSTINSYKKENEAYRKEQAEWLFNYEATIWFIKSHEGFNNGYEYLCPAGKRTIGYGHIIQPNENICYRISESQADSILRSDFNKAVQAVERNTNLKGTRKLAISHFIYSCGVGNFCRSEMKNLILENKPIDDVIVKMCYYRNADNQFIKSSFALKLRKWELQMYNKIK